MYVKWGSRKGEEIRVPDPWSLWSYWTYKVHVHVRNWKWHTMETKSIKYTSASLRSLIWVLSGLAFAQQRHPPFMTFPDETSTVSGWIRTHTQSSIELPETWPESLHCHHFVMCSGPHPGTDNAYAWSRETLYYIARKVSLLPRQYIVRYSIYNVWIIFK